MAKSASSVHEKPTEKTFKPISDELLLTGSVPLCTEQFDFSKMRKLTWEEANDLLFESIKPKAKQAKASR
jgi:hypothetical protein